MKANTREIEVSVNGKGWQTMAYSYFAFAVLPSWKALQVNSEELLAKLNSGEVIRSPVTPALMYRLPT